MTSRRDFLQQSALGAGAFIVGGRWNFLVALNDKPLIESVATACQRLAPLGWRQMLLDATAGRGFAGELKRGRHGNVTPLRA